MTPEPSATDVVLPARRLASSEALGWRSVLARSYVDDPHTEAFTTPATDRPLVVLATGGISQIESRTAGRWRRAVYREGSIGLTAPGNTSTLRWRSLGPEPVTSVHLHLDPGLFPGPAPVVPDTLTADDRLVRELARALAWALRTGAPALYADQLAATLAAHLAVRRPAAAPTRGGLTPGTLRAVTDHLRTHLADDVTLDDLSAVARLSKHHLLRAFRVTTGATPHAFLTELRMGRAAELLRDTSLPVGRVAVTVGYANASRFGAAFRRHHGVTPGRYRAEL